MLILYLIVRAISNKVVNVVEAMDPSKGPEANKNPNPGQQSNKIIDLCPKCGEVSEMRPLIQKSKVQPGVVVDLPNDKNNEPREECSLPRISGSFGNCKEEGEEIVGVIVDLNPHV